MDEISIKRIKNILNLAEQGTHDIPYSKVEVMNDGPGQIPQITLSVGFTQYGSNLGKVIKEYRERSGKESKELSSYRMDDRALPSNAAFKAALRRAGSDEIMQAIQEDLYTSLYIGPAIKWAEDEGFKEPLSYLVIADSFLHSGSILGFLRQRFPEKTPKNGGDEKAWIRAYVRERDKWLRTHSNKLLRNTVYRTNYFNQLLAKEDWDMDQSHTVAMNGTRPRQYA
jgi:chitosanase